MDGANGVPGVSRRSFLRGATALAGAGLVPGCATPTTGAAPEIAPAFEAGRELPWSNWAANQSCRPSGRAAPQSEDELASLFASATGSIRPVGAGHSFTALVPTDGTLLSLDRLEDPALDARDGSVQLSAGRRLHELGPLLAAQGLAMENLPDIDYQTLGGATATSTHGTGPRFGSLSSQLLGLTVVTPEGHVLECDAERQPELFAAARCSLGVLGAVTRMRVRVQPAFELVERSRLERLEPLLEDLDSRFDASRHFELLAFPHSDYALTVGTNEETGPPPENSQEDPYLLFEIRDAYKAIAPLPWIGPAIYRQIFETTAGAPEDVRSGPSYSVLAHDRMIRFREMEYTVPVEAGPACLREILTTIRERGIPVMFPIEYRHVRRDDVWLSMFSERDGASISIHQFHDEDYRPYFRAIEPIFWKYDGRPHWGKLHSLGAKELAPLYPHFRDFAELRRELDPSGRMLNSHLRSVFGAEG